MSEERMIAERASNAAQALKLVQSARAAVSRGDLDSCKHFHGAADRYTSPEVDGPYELARIRLKAKARTAEASRTRVSDNADKYREIRKAAAAIQRSDESIRGDSLAELVKERGKGFGLSISRIRRIIAGK
jgi:hypothetical protein